MKRIRPKVIEQKQDVVVSTASNSASTFISPDDIFPDFIAESGAK